MTLGIARLTQTGGERERPQLRLYDSTGGHVRRQLAPVIALCLTVPCTQTLVVDEREQRHKLHAAQESPYYK